MQEQKKVEEELRKEEKRVITICQAFMLLNWSTVCSISFVSLYFSQRSGWFFHQFGSRYTMGYVIFPGPDWAQRFFPGPWSLKQLTKGRMVNPLCQRKYCSRHKLNVSFPETALLCPRKAKIIQELLAGNRENPKPRAWWNHSARWKALSCRHAVLHTRAVTGLRTRIRTKAKQTNQVA